MTKYVSITSEYAVTTLMTSCSNYGYNRINEILKLMKLNRCWNDFYYAIIEISIFMKSCTPNIIDIYISPSIYMQLTST